MMNKNEEIAKVIGELMFMRSVEYQEGRVFSWNELDDFWKEEAYRGVEIIVSCLLEPSKEMMDVSYTFHSFNNKIELTICGEDLVVQGMWGDMLGKILGHSYTKKIGGKGG